MRELIDCHVHTERCGHAVGTVTEYVDAGVERGLSAIVMTEHLPLPDELDPDRSLSMSPGDVDDYLAEIVAAREAYPQIEVIAGIEADYLPSRVEETREQLRDLKRKGVRVVLGSVHMLGDWTFDDPNDTSEWDRRDVDDVWREYFDTWNRAARTKLFNVMAHPDLVKKFGHFPSFDPRPLYTEAARAALESEVIIEVSTAGLRKPVGEIYPGPQLLRAFRDAGVLATVASDAHAPAEVGYGIEEAYDAMKAAGFELVTLPISRYEQRGYQL